MVEALGPKLRRQRRRLGLTLDELAGRTGISKPYLSLIETERVPNPPSDEKLRRLEQTLGFTAGELVTMAHLHRTPRDVRAMISQLISDGATKRPVRQAPGDERAENSNPSSLSPDLDDAYLSGALQQFVEKHAGNVEAVRSNAVPVINKVAAGYPADFTDMGYPPRIADDYVGCPDVNDKDAFAARVHGDSMTPKYREGDIVIFSPAAATKNGDDCFVRFDDGQTTFKRVFFESDDSRNAMIRLQPRNEKYAPRIVPAQKITGIYKAKYKYENVED